MADIASLLQELQPRRRSNPFDEQRKYAQLLMQQGGSTEPVRTPLAGLARALQGGIGGALSGYTDTKEKQDNADQIAGLTELYNAPPGPARDAAMAKLSAKGDISLVGPILGQLLQQKYADERKNGILDRRLDAGGIGVPGAATGTPTQGAPAIPGMPGGEGGTTINITPRAPPNTQGAAQSPDAQRAMQFLVTDPDLKMAPHQAAGLVGNLYRESTMSPTAVNPRDGADGSNSVGLAQWNADRAQKLQQFAQANKANPADFNTQMQFLKSELLGSERPQFDALRQTGSVDDAAAASVGFFRPKDAQTAALNGTQYADAILRGSAQSQGFSPTNVGAADVPGALTQMPAQGSADPTRQAAPIVAPPAPQASQMPEIAPQAQTLTMQAQRLRAGGDREGALELMREAEKVQAAYAGKRAEVSDTRTYEDQLHTRREEEGRRYKEGQQAQPQPKEHEELRAARSDAVTLVSALNDFKAARASAGTEERLRSKVGMNTPLNTSFNTAALLAKGKVLFDLGVLNGPDLDIIRRTLPDPSSLGGATATTEATNASVDKVIDLIQTRLSAKEQALGLGVTDIRKLSDTTRKEQPGIKAPPADDLRKKYGLE